MAPAASIQCFQVLRGGDLVTISVGGGAVLKAARGGKAGNWKGLVSFRVRVLSIFVKNNKIQFRGQHLYDRWDLTMDLELSEVPRGRAHELWPSDLEDDFEADSIVGAFTIYHHRIVDALYSGQQPAALKARQIFMFQSTYLTRKASRLPKFVTAPKFPDPMLVHEWPILDCKLFDGALLSMVQAIRAAMNVVNKGGRQSLKVPLPLSCIPALLALPWSFRTATASYIFELNQHVLDTLLGKGWDTKLVDRGFEKVKAQVVLTTLKLRYHFARQNLLITFWPRRFKWDRTDRSWMALDMSADEVVPAKDRLHFQVFVGDEFHGDVVMAPGDSLADVRSEITLRFESSASSPLPDLYTFSQPGDVACRPRNEARYKVEKYLVAVDSKEGEIHINDEDPPKVDLDDV